MATLSTMYCTLMMLLILCASPAFSQGVLRGSVTDATSQEPMIGANVMLVGTSLGTATDLYGNFRIVGIPSSAFKVRISCVGYVTAVVDADFSLRSSIDLAVALKQDVVQVEGVVVTAQMRGQLAAINQQINSSTITNVVSSDKLMEMPMANAAEAVGRLPGVSILRSGGEGNKVTLRGLSPTYNAITIGGDRIASTDLDDRSVDLSMIAPEAISGIELTKVLTPDKDEDAIGGTVDFQLATAPHNGYKMDIRIQKGYNDQRHDYGDYRGRLTVSNRYFDEQLGLLITGNLERTQRGSDQLKGDYDLVSNAQKAPGVMSPITALTSSFIHTLDVRKRLGFNAMADYEWAGGRILANNFFSRMDRAELIRTKKFDYSSSGKMKYYLRDRENQIDIFNTALTGKHDLDFLKFDWKLSRNASSTRYPYNSIFEFESMSAFPQLPMQRSMADIIASAHENIGSAYLYKGSFEPNKLYERDFAAHLNLDWNYIITTTVTGRIKTGFKYRAKLRERDMSLITRRLDTTEPMFAPAHSLYGSPGFEYVRDNTRKALMLNYVDQDFTADDFLAGDYVFGTGLNSTELRHFMDGYLLDDYLKFSLQRDMDDYHLDDHYRAGYLMTDIHFGSMITFMPGVRYSSITIFANAKRGDVAPEEDEGNLNNEYEKVQDTTSVIRYQNWYPMIHLRIQPVDWFDVRLAYTKTVSYPRYDFIMPAYKKKGSELRLILGKADLRPQMSTNYDAYFSFYGNKIGLLTLGGFHKKIDDLIWLRSRPIATRTMAINEGLDPNLAGYTMDRPENNIYETTVKGYELDWQSNFNWLPRPFDGLVVSINYSRIWSSTIFPLSFVRTVKEYDPGWGIYKDVPVTIDTTREGQMPDQAAEIGNVSLGYDIGGLSLRVSMALQGKTLSFVGAQAELDGYTDTYTRWDLSVKYKLTDWMELYGDFYNFTNTPDKSYTQSEGYIKASEYYDWTADMGITIKF